MAWKGNNVCGLYSLFEIETKTFLQSWKVDGLVGSLRIKKSLGKSSLSFVPFSRKHPDGSRFYNSSVVLSFSPCLSCLLWVPFTLVSLALSPFLPVPSPLSAPGICLTEDGSVLTALHSASGMSTSTFLPVHHCCRGTYALNIKRRGGGESHRIRRWVLSSLWQVWRESLPADD